MAHPSLALALALTAGLVTGLVVDAPLVLAESLVLSASWTSAVLAYRRGLPRLLLASLAAAAGAAGCILGVHAVDQALHTPLRAVIDDEVAGFRFDAADPGRMEEPVVIEGRLRDDAAPSASNVTLRVEVERVTIGHAARSVAGGIAVGVGGASHTAHLAEWTAGRRIRAPVLLRRPARYLNHGLGDQERALARRGVTLIGTIKSASLVEVLAAAPWWDEKAASVRARSRAALDRHVRPRGERSAAIATAILIGDRSHLDADVQRRLQEAGTYHVIAISGGNIAILVGLALGGLAWAGLRGRLAASVTIVVVGAYAFVAAGGASVARAALMAAVYLAVRLIDHRTSPANAIGLAGTALLLFNPLAVADVGFWLTFGATAAIVLGASIPARWRGWRRAVLAVLVASCCAELALAPVSAAIFQRVTVAGLLLNFAALPAMTAVQLGAMLVVGSDLAGATSAATWAAAVVHAGSVILTESTRLLDLAPWLTWRVPSPPVWVMGAYYAAATVAIVSRRRAGALGRLHRAAAAAAAVLFLVLVAAPQARGRVQGDGRLHLTTFDVGQGDAMLVTFPNGRLLLVDTGGAAPGGEFDIGDRVLGPALRARGILRLDYLAVTHGDPDHVGGARSLVRDFEPREVWWGVPVAHHEPTAVVRVEADRGRAAWRTLQRGDRLEIGGVEIRAHHPPPPDWERQRVRNDDSLVLELRFGTVSMLLTGDIGRGVERDLLPTLDLLPTRVLKVAHHGSGTSSAAEFVDEVRPAVALIGVGRGNPYGHPLPAVLARLHGVGAAVFRTDRDGETGVVTDGRVVQVETWTGRRLAR